MRLIILSPADDVPREQALVGTILRDLPVSFHLRKPGWSTAGMAAYLEGVPSDLHPRIMIHGHEELLARFNLMGAHFTESQRRRHPQRIQRFHRERPDRRISSAFHRIRDISDEHGPFDYIFLSPIFDSLSKPGYRAAFQPDDLRSVLSTTRQSVVALGGIDAQRIAPAAVLGFKGVAVLGAVWGAASPHTAAERLWAQCRSIRMATT